MGRLRVDLQARIAQVKGAPVAVAYQNLGASSDSLYLEADHSFHAASTMTIRVAPDSVEDAKVRALLRELPALELRREEDGRFVLRGDWRDVPEAMTKGLVTRVRVAASLSAMEGAIQPGTAAAAGALVFFCMD